MGVTHLFRIFPGLTAPCRSDGTSFDRRRIDLNIFQFWILQSLGNFLPCSCQAPAVVPPPNRVISTKSFGEICPRNPGFEYKNHTFDKESIVGCSTTGITGFAGTERFEAFPKLIRKCMSLEHNPSSLSERPLYKAAQSAQDRSTYGLKIYFNVNWLCGIIFDQIRIANVNIVHSEYLQLVGDAFQSEQVNYRDHGTQLSQKLRS